ncbi:MAG: DNA-processing protein DprA [Candidatus Doudnabacteria bacterium]|nr:DNA-processing protein DprA [Candidatus Doudnabacteria bacterium]
MSTLIGPYWHALNLILPSELWKLLPISQALDGPEAFFRVEENRLIQAGLDPSSTAKIIAGRNKINPAIEWERLMRTGIQTITIEQDSYPRRLKEIHSSPPIIYARGETEVLNEKLIAIVGSRKMTGYGKDVINNLVPDISNFGLHVISGMAFGVDSYALECCLNSGGSAVGVLASSLDWHEISPRSNIALAKRIINKGCLISENPPGRRAHKMYFPLRNRIISGLSIGVLVVEAAPESGSLITAKAALEQNREVFAVPGSIFSENCAGTIELIKNGAKCVTCFRDIAQEFNWDIVQIQKTLDLENPTLNEIRTQLARSPLSLNSLIEYLKLPAAEILSALTELEIRGLIWRSAEGLYAKIK